MSLLSSVCVTYNLFKQELPLCDCLNNFKRHIEVALSPPKKYTLMAEYKDSHSPINSEYDYQRSILASCKSYYIFEGICFSTEPLIHNKLSDYTSTMTLRTSKKIATVKNNIVPNIKYPSYITCFSIRGIDLNANNITIKQSYPPVKPQFKGHFIRYNSQNYFIAPIDTVLKQLEDVIFPHKVYILQSIMTNISGCVLHGTSFRHGTVVFTTSHEPTFELNRMMDSPSVIAIPDKQFEAKIAEYNENDYTWIVCDKMVPSELSGYPYMVNGAYGGMIISTVGCLYSVSANQLCSILDNPRIEPFESFHKELDNPFWWSQF